MSAASETDSTGGAAAASAAAAPRCRILIVEDDAASARILAKICGNLGARVSAAPTITAAREMLHREILFDLIFLDSQLGPEWGWVLLGELRGDPLFQKIPVVVYTGHTERASLLQYIDLGVQNVRAKPFRADVVAAEVEKALKFGWPAKMLQPAAEVCERLHVPEEEYHAILSTAVIDMERVVQDIKGQLGQRASAKQTEVLRDLRVKAQEVGVTAFEVLIDAMQAALERRDLPYAVRCVHRFDQLIALLHARCAAHFKTGVLPTPKALPMEKVAELPSPKVPPPAASSGTAASLGRRIASGPAWTIGASFARLKSVSLFSRSDLERMATDALRQQPVAGFLECQRRIENIPGSGLDTARAMVRKLPGFSAPFYRILEQRGLIQPDEDREYSLDRLGFEPALILCEAARAASCTMVDSPLSLSHAMLHSLTTAQLAYEFGRYFHLANAHLLFAQGLLCDVGRWAIMVMEPGFYTVAIGLAQAEGADLAACEKQIFGVSMAEFGEMVLGQAGLRSLYTQGTRFAGHPGVPLIAEENAVSVAVLHLAMELAHAVGTDDKAHSAKIVERLSLSTHACWQILESQHVSLPLGAKETVVRFARVAASCHWAAMVLGNWAVVNKLA